MSVPFEQVARRAGEWLRGSGPLHEIVISTRVRLARNVAGRRFLSRADAEARAAIADDVEHAVRRVPALSGFAGVDVENIDELDRRLLVERQLISRQHADGSGARRVAFDAGETAALMINEEDHLRLQVMRSGLQLEQAWQQINALDDALSDVIEYAFHEQFGYLTACPTNVGTGIRVSVMLHLPALRLTGELDKVISAARELRLAVRGLHGEGTEALGDFFQISNQVTLGCSEESLIEEFERAVVPRIVRFEEQARAELVDKKLAALDDKVFRAVGLLQGARLISSSEALQCLSHVRMGLHCGRLRTINLQTVNELFLQTQPAHLQKLQGERLNGEQRSAARAELIRTRLSRN